VPIKLLLTFNIMVNMNICKYYQVTTEEMPLGPFGKNIFNKHKCNKIIIDKNGDTVHIKECWHFKVFKKCEYFEEKAEN